MTPESCPQTEIGVTRFPCGQCGAKLIFAPGQTSLVCEHCGFENAIDLEDTRVEEVDYVGKLNELAAGAETIEVSTVKCDACAAQMDRPPTLDAFKCVYCGADVLGDDVAARIIRPRSLLPFHVSDEKARSVFRAWINSRWFAPSGLKRYARTEGGLNGVYIPYWTYDSRTLTDYTGQRGDHYWVTEHYTTTVNGKRVTRTRRVRKTRWYPASGRVQNSFDDLLILASRSLPRKYADRLEPWDLQNLVSYQDEFVAGFRAERYQVELDQGFEEAKTLMDGPIRQTIRRDVGGDEQRIHSIRVTYYDISFKHVLLPVWISAYRFRERVYRVLVNARTGEVQGERPWSLWKIFLAAAGGVGAVAAILLVWAAAGG